MRSSPCRHCARQTTKSRPVHLCQSLIRRGMFVLTGIDEPKSAGLLYPPDSDGNRLGAGSHCRLRFLPSIPGSVFDAPAASPGYSDRFGTAGSRARSRTSFRHRNGSRARFLLRNSLKARRATDCCTHVDAPTSPLSALVQRAPLPDMHLPGRVTANSDSTGTRGS